MTRWINITAVRAGLLGVAAFALPSRAAACAACEARLIDMSMEPPTVFSPDAREGKPLPSGPPLRTERGPAVAAARQPQGALSGRIVFMNGGHGWTWGPTAWRLQRGVTNEMNEDYGNLDQMNAFAAWCWNAGAVVVPMRPLGYQNNSVKLDNDDADVTWAGAWSDSSSGIFYGSAGDLPYRFAALADTETATATYTPNIPQEGRYPVYTWVRHGPDRGHQLYRIRHTGGETEARIPHHMVGNGWVYLGEYYFAAGRSAASGSVVISNRRGSADGDVIIADAIRFGNGMGSVDCGDGVSSYPHHEENCRYWIQSQLGQGQSSTLYDGGGADESDSWSAPPKMSAEMNREQTGSLHDRIHISFHSNAGGGRGATALITGTPTTNQTRLAQLCGAEVNNDLVSLGSPPLEVPWQTRSSTYTGGYSEIDGSLFDYEMDATIIEVAFHDSADDAKLLRDPKVRSAIARASMHAVVKYMNEFGGGPLAFLPEPPSGLRAQAGILGTVHLNWTAPVAAAGSGAPTGYVIYRSTNGYGFGTPVTVGNITSYTITGLTPGAEYYFQVAAVNAGGESFPSEVAGCRLPQFTGARQVLIVNAYDRYDRTQNLRQDVTRQAYAPPDATGATERVLPLRNNSFDYVVPHGQAVAAAGFFFDSCQNEQVAAGTVNLADYGIVIWAAGQESTADESFSSTEQTKVSAFRNAGGQLMVSGSEIAWDLDRSSGPSAADRAFFNSHLRADLAGNANDDSGSYAVQAAAGSIFSGMTGFTFDDGTGGIYPVQTPDVLTPAGSGSLVALTYAGNANGAAAVQYDGSAGGGRVVYLGFPFETIGSSAARREVMRRTLNFLKTPDILAAGGAIWRYRDTGSPPSTNWTTPAYSDAGWSSGPARLGYGGDGEQTTMSNGGNAANVHPVIWLRQTFTVTNAAAWTALLVEVQRDDGIAVWLNGTELLRDNLSGAAVSAHDFAATAVGGADESAWRAFTVPATALVSGTNVLAVQLHQAAANSSDTGFDLRLRGLTQAAVTFAGWQAALFGSDAGTLGLAGDSADPDSDGRVNLMEYALGTRPGAADVPATAASAVVSGRFVFRFARSVIATDLTYTVQASSSAAGPWTVIARGSGGSALLPLVAGTAITESGTGTLRTVEVLDSTTATSPAQPRRFFRLHVSR